MVADPRRNEPGDESHPRKAYQAPHLWVYGNIREITQTLGRTSMNSDGGTATNKKTH